MINKYLYNSKEQQNQTGWYAYGFRRLSPQLERWHVANAMAENYTSQSPYNYVGNNPVSRTDFMGLTYSRKNLEWQQFVTETEQLNYRYGHRSGSGGWGSILDPRNSYGHYYYEQVNMLGTVDDIQNTTINDVVLFIFKNDGVSVFFGNNLSGFFGHDKQGNLYSLVINGFGRINFTGKVRVSDIITTNADGSRGVNWEGLADYFGDNDFESSESSSNWWERNTNWADSWAGGIIEYWVGIGRDGETKHSTGHPDQMEIGRIMANISGKYSNGVAVPNWFAKIFGYATHLLEGASKGNELRELFSGSEDPEWKIIEIPYPIDTVKFGKGYYQDSLNYIRLSNDAVIMQSWFMGSSYVDTMPADWANPWIGYFKN